MKKVVLLLMSVNLIIINTAQLINCSINDPAFKSRPDKNTNENKENEQFTIDYQTDFIVDINAKDNTALNTARGWKGTLNDPDDLNQLTKNPNFPYPSFTNKQKTFIKNFTTAVHTVASKQSIDKFNNFLEQKTFTTFDELVNTINIHNKTSNSDAYIDVPLALIRDHARYPIEFEKILLKIYNTICTFFGKNYGYKMLRTLAITRKKTDELSNELGQTNYNFQDLNHQSMYIKIDEDVLTNNVNYQSYQEGWFTVANMYGTFVHEFGHLIDFFHTSFYPFHETIDNTSGLNNDLSSTAVPHNEYKVTYCQNANKNNEFCPYQINPSYKKRNLLSNSQVLINLIEKHTDTNIKYKFDQNSALKNFIFKKVKNLRSAKVEASFIDNVLLKMFINSRYGRTSDVEIPSEGFAYWLLTPENERDKAWEIWNEFFLDYLPALRKAKSHFNDYLKI